jgi:ubiquinol-cytochrome c reductase cytochrome b subunit
MSQMYNFLCFFTIIYLLLISPIDFNLNFLKKIRLKGQYRIGPHNKNVISIIVGSLLGDAHAEKRLKGVGTRICFHQENTHIEYILWLHKTLADLNYCNPKIPIFKERLGFKGKIRKVVRFTT